ncbi:MAG: stage III sporulation protein AE [Clostridia bacterium]|nr:stage III sporulation protein AE [Clostridia bacterium]
MFIFAMEGRIIKKIFNSVIIIIVLICSNTCVFANSIYDNSDLDNFLDEIKKYSNEYFPELSDNEYLSDLISGKITTQNNNIINKIINMVIGEFKDNISLILKIIGIVMLCSVLKSIQSNFSDSGISDIAFYTCYLMIVTLIITSFTNVVSLCTNTVDKLSDFMNMIVPLIIALITISGGITSISFLQPLIIGMITLITYLLNNIIIPIIYISTVINIVTNISEHVKLSKLSETLKKSSLWIMEICMVIFVGVLSLEGTLAASVDGMTTKIAKNIVSSTIPVVGKILGDTVDSVIGSVAITKNAVGFIGIIAILAITISPLIKCLITLFVINISTAIIEPVADSRIFKSINDVSNSIKIMVGIMAVVIFMFIIAITMMLKISNTALMYK